MGKKQEKKKKPAQKAVASGGQERMTKAEKKARKKTEAKEEKAGVMEDIDQMLQGEKGETQKTDLTGGKEKGKGVGLLVLNYCVYSLSLSG